MQETQFIKATHLNYLPDVLGDSFGQLTLPHKDDYEGKVQSTLIRRKSESPTQKAVLYVHGFNDYFFQAHLAKWFNQQNYDFYALDLRKYGRSYQKHQKLNNVRSLSEYDEEIDLALQIIRQEDHHEVILMGHSTGGLILTNYAGNHLNSDLFQGLICNSPFYDFNLTWVERKLGIPLLSLLGRYFPDPPISSGLSPLYGHSLHKDQSGEWSYSLAWKSHKIPKVNLGFIRAIHQAQKKVKKGIHISVPVLVMHSSKSVFEKEWSDQFKEGDAVLNVRSIRKYAQRIKADLTVVAIENGLHDLFLSKKPVREKVFEKVEAWISSHFKSN